MWALALAALLVGVALRLGAADWYTDYPLTGPDGAAIALPRTFAANDHPFHLAKERAAVDALRRGWLPRWFANHQGGFPAEFYPLGGDVVVAAVYFLGLGRIPLAVCHQLVVIGVLLVPPLAYWAIARRERLPGSVAVLAALLHLFLRGNWLAGGSEELIAAGLWPQVFAFYLPLLVILWGADWLRRGDRRGLLLAAGAATLAVYANPRAIFGVAAAGAAVGIVAASEHRRLGSFVTRLRNRRRVGGAAASRERLDGRRRAATAVIPQTARAAGHPLMLLAGRAALLTALVGLLAAPLLLPLRAHQHLYHFTHFVGFLGPRDVWQWYREAIPPPVIQLAGLGIVIGFLRSGFYGRVFACLLPLSYLIVTLVGSLWRDLPVFAQLEGPRLLPMLRPATIFLAALGVHETVRAPLRLVRLRGATMLGGGATVALAAWLLLASRSPLDRGQRGLPLAETTNQPAFTAIARSALTLAAASTPADKALIIGSPLSSHASFWVPALTGRDVYHDDWPWLWRTVPYAAQELGDDGRSPHVLADAPGALGRDFLARHGLTLVLLDTGRGDLLELAAAHPHLRQLDPGAPGGYAVYRVAGGAANGWLTFGGGGEVTALDVGAERLRAVGRTERAGVARVIVNDFPRWRARVNGEPVPIARAEDGYMQVPVPAGEVTIALDYSTAPVGWLARGLLTLGLLL
ncbi:MAG: YfhO family protein, partial [Chloroflexota bacterium]|nr:YfhO family protein [Chloroflexota bacterium]